MAKKSRQDRWSAAHTELADAFEPFKTLVEEYRSMVEDRVNTFKERLTEDLQALYDEFQEKAGVHTGRIEDALSSLKDVKSEYDSWEEPKAEATREKLEAVQNIDLEVTIEINTTTDLDSIACEIDITPDLDEFQTFVEEVETIELPLGFGRD